MAARKVLYAPREVAGEPRDPQRWCKSGQHIAIPYQPGKKICQICQSLTEDGRQETDPVPGPQSPVSF